MTAHRTSVLDDRGAVGRYDASGMLGAVADLPRQVREGWRSTRELERHAPSSLAGAQVVRTVALDTRDGFKFWIEDGSWLLVRFSGTEPLVRVYVEATSGELRDEMLRAGEQLVRGTA